MNNEKIIDNFNNNGLVIIDKFLNQDEINHLKNFVDIKYFENNKNNFFLAGENFENAYVDKLNIIKKVQNLFFDLSNKLSLKSQNENIYKVLRVVDGKMSKDEAHRYHFDAHLFTVLLPIYIPNNENNKNGDLVIAPNFRKISKNVLVNIMQKLLYQNFIFKKFLHKKIIRDLFNFQQLNLQVGNLYLFNGYRSLHGNLEINSIDRRATLLIHYYDLFKESKLVQLNRKIRINKEQNKIKKNKNQSNNL